MDFGLIALLTGVASSPLVTLRHIAQTAPFGMAAWTLLGLGALFGLGMSIADGMPYQRRATQHTPLLNAGMTLLFGGVLIPCIWLWMSMVTKGILCALGVRANIETIFCLLVFAAAPQFIGWAAYPLRGLNVVAYRIYQVGMAGVSLWMTALVGVGLYAAYGVEGWRLFLASLPLPALLWTAGISAAWGRPNSFSATRRWQKARGERVLVFAPPDADKCDVEQVVRRCDWAWRQAALMLEVELPAFQVGVFLFADAQEHKRAMQIKKGEVAGGYAHDDFISLGWGKPLDIETTAAHEFAHILDRLWAGAKPPALLDEGLAVYIESELLPLANTHKPVIRLPYALRVLAHDALFYEWTTAAHTEYSADYYYSHAHSFVRYLIRRSGLTLFKQLLREAAPKKTKEDKNKGEGERMADAVSKVYGLSLPELETEWRQSGKSPHFRLPLK